MNIKRREKARQNPSLPGFFDVAANPAVIAVGV
jgi:hypothetical protein